MLHHIFDFLKLRCVVVGIFDEISRFKRDRIIIFKHTSCMLITISGAVISILSCCDRITKALDRCWIVND